MAAKKWSAALLDQLLVSGGGFLTIAIGAHLLDLLDQGKLAYVISAYMVTVLLNVAMFFYAAPIVKFSIAEIGYYKYLLQKAQAYSSLVTSLIIAVLFLFFGNQIGWDISIFEFLLLFVFLFMQQLADFKRRASYVFSSTLEAAAASLLTYGFRIGILLIVFPHSIVDVLFILAATSTIGAATTVISLIRGSHQAGISSYNIMREHVRLSKWAILNAPLGWACFFLPVFILGYLDSAKSAAVLVSIRSIGSAANVLLELLETIVPVWLAHIASKANHKELHSSTSRIGLIGGMVWIIGLGLIASIGSWGINLLLGEKYTQYVDILILTWIGNGIHFISRIVGLHWRVKKMVKVEIVGTVGGLILLALSLPILVTNYGLLGAVWSYITIALGIVVAQVSYLKWFAAKN